MRFCLAVALILSAGSAPGDQATHLQSYSWQMDHPNFGGISGLEVASDGTTFTAVSDRGFLLHGDILRDEGRIQFVRASRPTPIPGIAIARTSPKDRDSEGIAISEDGTIYISFEQHHHVSAYVGGTFSHTLPSPSAFSDFRKNSSLEALAIDGDQRLYTLPERSGQINAPFPLFRYDGTSWRKIHQIARSGGFEAVGADIGPDGKFYLLERGFSGLGFRSRLRRFALTEEGLGREETLIETTLNQYDNLEGISVWRAPDGLRVTLVSDDNYRGFQQTQLVEYALPD